MVLNRTIGWCSKPQILNFPKRSDLSVHSAETLSTIAAKLNDRPRKRLNWVTPAKLFVSGLGSHEQAGVATTA